MNLKIIYGAAGILFLALMIWLLSADDEASTNATTMVERGDVKITVTTTGELQAKESEKVLGPTGMRKANIWQTNITDMVAEGTVVDSGDYIATLDRTEVADKLKNLYSEMDKAQSQYIAQKLDTSLTLRTARNELVNLKYAMEEKKLIYDQSKYEAPAVQRQAQIDMEKAGRAYTQAVENYALKVEQAEAKTNEVFANFSQIKNNYEFTEKLLGEFRIMAPKSGMVIYFRDWEGNKVQVGSRVSTWNPVVATLPNLDKMISVTYVNEVDISKVKEGQRVNIGIDAFQGKNFQGEITSVANVGEQMQNTDAKVFEVVIELNESDSILRPAMTTSNEILVGQYTDVLYLPIEAVYSFGKMKAVYLDQVGSPAIQEVHVGPSNENYIIIEAGLEAGDEVLIVSNADKVSDTLKIEPQTAAAQ
jgi:RND family efflux transporter MFP subunit